MILDYVFAFEHTLSQTLASNRPTCFCSSFCYTYIVGSVSADAAIPILTETEFRAGMFVRKQVVFIAG